MAWARERAAFTQLVLISTLMATPKGDLVAAILAVADNKTFDVQKHYKLT